MNKVITMDQVMDKVHDGASIMIGGFLGVGTPLCLVNALAQKGVKDLTVIAIVSTNPPGNFDLSILFKNKQIKKFISAHIGTSPELQELYNNNEIEIELSPMGTWTERIRCGGYGLGGCLTPVGLGTKTEEGKQKVEVDGKEYLLEKPLRAEFAFIKGWRADPLGNVQYRGAAVNSNPIIASAADFTVAEVNEIVKPGDIDPSNVGTPSVFVKGVVQGNTLEEQEKIIGQRWYDTGRFTQ